MLEDTTNEKLQTGLKNYKLAVSSEDFCSFERRFLQFRAKIFAVSVDN